MWARFKTTYHLKSINLAKFLLSIVIVHWNIIGELFLEIPDIIEYNSNFMYKLTKKYHDKINVLVCARKD